MAKALEQALAKLAENGNVDVEAPEWSNAGDRTLAARAGISVLLFALVVGIVVNAGKLLPSEQTNETLRAAFVQRAEDASTDASNALTKRVRAAKTADASKRALLEAKKAKPAVERTDADKATFRALRATRAADARALRDAISKDELLARQRAMALDDVKLFAPNPDMDLVRAIGIGILALVALLGAAALLSPRNSQMLRIRRVFKPASPSPNPNPNPDEPQVLGLMATGKGVAAGAPGRSTSSSKVGSGIAQAEPALTQGVLAAATLAAGLFGIQNLEGTAETVLNLTLPLIPILGALFTRARVTPTPLVSYDERARVFGM